MGYISEDYCSEELSGMLMEKGYIGAINTYIGKDDIKVEQITIQSAMKWLREVNEIFIAINMVPKIPGGIEDKRCYFFQPYKNRIFHNFPLNYSIKIYSTYEQACEAAIKYCLKNLI